MSIISKIKQNLLNTFYPKHIKCICCKSEIKINNIAYLVVLDFQSEDLIELLSELLLERIKDDE